MPAAATALGADKSEDMQGRIIPDVSFFNFQHSSTWAFDSSAHSFIDFKIDLPGQFQNFTNCLYQDGAAHKPVEGEDAEKGGDKAEERRASVSVISLRN